MNITDLVNPLTISILALLVSSAAFYVGWMNYRRDNSRLVIDLNFYGSSTKGMGFEVVLVNKGRRPVRVEKVVLKMPAGQEIPPFKLFQEAKLPVTLEESESIKALFYLSFNKSVVSSPLQIKGALAVDTTGRQYKKKVSRELKDEIAQEWASEMRKKKWNEESKQ